MRIIDVRDPAPFIIEAGMAGEHGHVNLIGKIHALGHTLHLIFGIPGRVPRQWAEGDHHAAAMTSDSSSSLSTSSPWDKNQVQMFRQSR